MRPAGPGQRLRWPGTVAVGLGRTWRVRPARRLPDQPRPAARHRGGAGRTARRGATRHGPTVTEVRVPGSPVIACFRPPHGGTPARPHSRPTWADSCTSLLPLKTHEGPAWRVSRESAINRYCAWVRFVRRRPLRFDPVLESVFTTLPSDVASAPRTTDVVFTFSMEMFEDAVRREFCRPPDQTLLALARDPRIGRLLVADSWRSYIASAARRRSPRLTGPSAVDGRSALRVRPHRLRRADSTRLGRSNETTGHTASLLGRALARAHGEAKPTPGSAALVTYSPFVAAFCRRTVDSQGRLLRPGRLGDRRGRPSMVGPVQGSVRAYRPAGRGHLRRVAGARRADVRPGDGHPERCDRGRVASAPSCAAAHRAAAPSTCDLHGHDRRPPRRRARRAHGECGRDH